MKDILEMRVDASDEADLSRWPVWHRLLPSGTCSGFPKNYVSKQRENVETIFLCLSLAASDY